MNAQTLSQQLQSVGLRTNVRFSKGIYRCTVRDRNGAMVTVSHGSSLDNTLLRALSDNEELRIAALAHAHKVGARYNAQLAKKKHALTL